MHLHGPFCETDIGGSLLAKTALSDLEHDLALSWEQSVETLPEHS
jgi:hypothetical protein